jgi:hypothetical protein
MMTDALFDDDPDEDNYVPSNYLVVPPRAESSDALNAMEEAYRSNGRPPVLFVDEMGQLENAAGIARAMSLPAGQVPTLEQATVWVAGICARANP